MEGMEERSVGEGLRERREEWGGRGKGKGRKGGRG